MSRRRIAGRTCRQLGSLKGRERRELTADHPLKQIYERRMNSIQRAVQRGSLDETLAEGMKRLAKDKLFRAISSNDYARDAYPAEMEQDSDVYRRRDGRPVPYGVIPTCTEGGTGDPSPTALFGLIANRLPPLGDSRLLFFRIYLFSLSLPVARCFGVAH